MYSHLNGLMFLLDLNVVMFPSEHKRKFHEWRKKHYDEFFAVKQARERKKVNHYDTSKTNIWPKCQRGKWN